MTRGSEAYSPSPKFEPLALPNQNSVVAVPSYIGESGLIGNWLFYNGAGGKLHDFSGQGNHGDIKGPTWKDGSYGWALDFRSAESDYATCPDDPSLHITGELTVEVWAYLHSHTSWGAFLCKPYLDNWSDPYHCYDFRLNDDTYEMDFGFTADGTNDHCSGDTVVSTGVWHQLGVARDSDGSTINFYLDGDPDGTRSPTTTGSLDTSTYKLTLGQRHYNDPGFFVDAVIAIIRLYNVMKGDSYFERSFESTRGIFGI